MKKLDLRKELHDLYFPSAKKVDLVRVPRFRFAMVDGSIPPGATIDKDRGFQEALQALYGVSFTLKFQSKLREKNPIDYPVMALEGLWWTESGRFDFQKDEPWLYRLMILQPGHITPAMFRQAVLKLKEKHDSPALAGLRLESFHEGLCVQTMHIGPYASEPATVERMAAFAGERGYVFSGNHHEIYLGDPRRAKPERLRTVLRIPVVRNGN
jgi:hypothetical protein